MRFFGKFATKFSPALTPVQQPQTTSSVNSNSKMISLFSNDDNDNNTDDDDDDDDDDNDDNDNNDDSNDNDTIYGIAAGASFPHFTFLSDVWDLQPDRKVCIIYAHTDKASCTYVHTHVLICMLKYRHMCSYIYIYI